MHAIKFNVVTELKKLAEGKPLKKGVTPQIVARMALLSVKNTK